MNGNDAAPTGRAQDACLSWTKRL